jgi:multisubunit Na+/H+ antiporter MnhB subunit
MRGSSQLNTGSVTLEEPPNGLENPDIPLNFGTGFRAWFRAGTSFLGVLTLVLIGLQFIFIMHSPDLNDPDVWWHMRNAEYLFQHHQFPRQDMYSFTVAGHPWLNHEWLSEVPFYLAYRAFGLVGLKSLTFFTSDLIFLLLLYLCYQESWNFKASIAACCFSTFLATVSFGPRTILFGYVYLLILLIVLQRFRLDSKAPLWIIPPLFCLWANTHGSWSLGLILFFLIGVSGLVGGVWGRIDSQQWTPSQLRKLVKTGVASLAALFVNPFGWRLVYYPFDLAFKQKLNIAHVQEWVSVDFHDLRGKLVLILILGLLLAALLRNRRWNLGEVLVLLFALYSGLTYIRFLVLLGIVAAPIIAKALDFFPPYRPELETPRVNAMVIFVMLGLMVYFWPREAKVRSSVEETYPAGVLPYLKAHPPQGNVLNFYLWGGYLGWHDPEMKDFVDSRVDIFEYAGVLKDYLGLLGVDAVQKRPEAILEKYKIDYVLFPPSDGTNPNLVGGNLVYVLEHDPRWKILYKDKICVLLGKQAGVSLTAAP